MTEDLGTLLTALYVEIDDHVAPPRQGRGRRPRLTDAELVCLAVAQVLLGFDCEHRWIRFAYCRLGHLFRYLPNQPGYHMRLRAAAPLLAQAISHLARVSPSWCDSLRLIDATPLPCGALRETVNRSDIGGTGGYGFCASHTRYYWGLKLYLVTAPDGMPITWCLADPKLPRAGGLPGPADHRRRSRAGCPRRHRAGRQGPGWPRHRTADRRARRAATAPGPPRRADPAWQPRRRPTVDRVGVRHPQGPNSAWSTTGPAPRMTCSPASLSACSPWPPRSGATGRSTPPTSAASSPTTTDPDQLQGIDHLEHPRSREVVATATVLVRLAATRISRPSRSAPPKVSRAPDSPLAHFRSAATQPPRTQATTPARGREPRRRKLRSPPPLCPSPR